MHGDPTHMWVWIFLNLAVAGLPLIANAVAHRRAKKKILSITLIDDGFLYFITFLLVIGLGADTIKNMLGPNTVPQVFIGAALGLGSLVSLFTWSAYCNQLHNRLIGTSETPLWMPLIVLVAVLICTLTMRLTVGLW